MRRVQRTGDMDRGSVLRLTVQDDGDVIVAIDGTGPVTGQPAYATIEFCNPLGGGGRSTATHAALGALFEAMKSDG